MTTGVATSQREAISGALSRVAGVSGYGQQPNSVSPLDGWPVFGGKDWTTPHVAAVTWNVMLALPAADLESATEAIDAYMDDVAEALTTISCASVIRAQPIQLAVSDQSNGFPALMFIVIIG